jgi:hypothetical protein
MGEEKESIIHIVLVVCILAILGNLILLDWVYLVGVPQKATQREAKSGAALLEKDKETISASPLGVGGQGPSEVNFSEEEKLKLLNACKAEISQAMSTISSQKGKTETVVTTPATSTKEYYVPLGSGEVTSLEWVEITGAEAYIDSKSYGRIKEVYFQANLRMPSGTGKVYAMLYNMTDKHPVFNSEVSSISTSGESVSSKINLDEGNKLYRLKMKLSIPHKGNCDLARVKIVTY